MLKTHFYAAMAFSLALIDSGCSTSRQTARESSRHITATTKTVTEPETIDVRLPVYSLRHTVIDSTSTLHTPVALSEARINHDGSLTHSLSTADTTLRVPVVATTVSTESTNEESSNSFHTNRTLPNASGWFELIVLGLIVIALLKKCR